MSQRDRVRCNGTAFLAMLSDDLADLDLSALEDRVDRMLPGG